MSVLAAADGGAYPYGNSVMIRGTDTTFLVDPSLALATPPLWVDAVVVSQAHEDDIVGLSQLAAPVFADHDDLAGAIPRRALPRADLKRAIVR